MCKFAAHHGRGLALSCNSVNPTKSAVEELRGWKESARRLGRGRPAGRCCGGGGYVDAPAHASGVSEVDYEDASAHASRRCGDDYVDVSAHASKIFEEVRGRRRPP